jgi:hypothetical protein
MMVVVVGRKQAHARRSRSNELPRPLVFQRPSSSALARRYVGITLNRGGSPDQGSLRSVLIIWRLRLISRVAFSWLL